MVVEANAKKNHQTVSEWIRHAVDEQIKRTVNSRALDRIDERVYDLTKATKRLLISWKNYSASLKGWKLPNDRAGELGRLLVTVTGYLIVTA